MRQLHDLVESVTNGVDFRNYVDDGTPFIRVADIKPDGIDYSNIMRVPQTVSDVSKRQRIRAGDILFTRKASFGVATVATKENESSIISSEIIRLVPVKGLNPYYLAIFNNSTIGQAQCQRHAVGAVMPGINHPTLLRFEVPAPPRSIQDAIAARMDAAYRRKRELEAEAKALLEGIDGYVLGKLGTEWGKPPDQGEPVGHEAVWFGTWRRDVKRLDPKRYRYQREGPPPKGMRRLGDLLMRRLEKVDRSKYAFEDLQLVSLHFDGSMSARDVKAWRKDIKGTLWFAYPGDLVYSKIDARNGAIGLVPDELGRIAVTSEFPVYQVKEGISAEYLKIVLRTPQFTGLLQAMAAGHSGRKRIQPRELEDVLIPVPLLNQQRKIAAEVQARQEQAWTLMQDAERVVAEAKAEVERMILGEEGGSGEHR